MSLVNLTPAVTTVVAVLDPILYDSGWKRASGTGDITTLETLKYDVDSVVRVFGRFYKGTVSNEWKLYYSMDDDDDSAQLQYWLNLSRMDQIRTGTNSHDVGNDYLLMVHNLSFSTSRAIDPYNASGLSMKANETARFKSVAAQTNEGIEYRIIVERSTSAVMLGRALGKPQ